MNTDSKTFIELMEWSYKAGFESAIKILESLRETSGFTKEQKDQLLSKLEDKK